ncbi:MAG TPA: LacI family DNA-binding transcriptional regulator [Capsulimonadaceae bacterium]|nr:LacI family DNA-binding transcriptional regulator [Capsulimonadaceae bacterium]
MVSIAARLGLSRATVAHVLNGRATEQRIRPETQSRVLDMARELGYRPNALARSVRSGKSRMIGYLVSEPRYEPYWNTLIGALAEAEHEGFTLKVLSASCETFADRIRQCIELRLGGLIVRVDLDKSALFTEASRAGIPVVTVDEGVPQPYGIRVSAADALGCKAAISHLVELGHCKIGFVSSGFGGPSPQNVPPREALFLQEMASRKLDVLAGYVTRETMLVYGHGSKAVHDTATGLAATDALLDHAAGQPTAIFCWRDEAALVAIQACHRRGLRVPENVSIVGFSDISAAWLCDPPLTTCVSPWEEMGRTAVRQLVAAIGQEFDPSPREILIPSGLVIRKSSGPVSR